MLGSSTWLITTIYLCLFYNTSLCVVWKYYLRQAMLTSGRIWNMCVHKLNNTMSTSRRRNKAPEIQKSHCADTVIETPHSSHTSPQFGYNHTVWLEWYKFNHESQTESGVTSVGQYMLCNLNWSQ